MKNWIEHFRAVAMGMAVSRVWRGHGSALLVEFGELTPATGRHRDVSSVAPSGEVGLMIEWSWRIEDERSIVCGSWSDEKLWELTFMRLVGQRIVDVTTFGRLPEILISLSEGFHVASFMTAEGDPEWALFDRLGPALVSVGCRSGTITDDV